MSWLKLVIADLARTPLRTFLTSTSLVLAFMLFGLLQPIRVMFNEGVELSGDKRLIVTPKHSVADMLPVKHTARIAEVPNVEVVAHMTWFGGIYQDPQNFFPQFAVTPREFLRINRELRLSPDAAQAFVTERRSALVGKATADRFGWQVGDTVSLLPSIWHNRDGTAWHFRVVGIFTSDNKSLLSDDGFYFGYDYFDEYRAFARGTVGTFMAAVQDGDKLAETADAIDLAFANSAAETRTQSGAEYALSFARQLGDVGAIAGIVLIAVLFTLLMLTGHAMTRSVHERTAEVAVMRVLGFKRTGMAILLVSEFVLLAVVTAGVGMLLADLLAGFLEQAVPQVSQFGGLAVEAGVVMQGLLLALVLSLLVALPPVVRAVVRPVVSALRVEA